MLQGAKQNHGLILDPRTKMLLLITISAFVLGGLGNDKMPYIVPCISALPLVLLLTGRKFKSAFIYAIAYTATHLAMMYLVPQFSGFLKFFLFGCLGILSIFIPGAVLGSYVVSTTTVSEFTAGMQKLHISEKVIIPLSVMFRFFPTLREEFSAINSAMRMRGISMGGGNVGKMVEYRIVPLMTCAAKIGEDLSAAALTRGLGGEVKRTNNCRIGFHIQDYILITLCVAAFVATAVAYSGVF